MKIGILTFHNSINNGAVIQCYSLCKELRKRFPNVQVEVVDYRMPKIDKQYVSFWRRCISTSSVITNIKRVINGLLHYRSFEKETVRTQVFRSVQNMLPLSAEKVVSDDPEPLFSYLNEHYDIIIAGSDAIWNYNARGFPNPYFLDDSISCPKLSYAASCYGMNYESVPQEHKIKIKQILDSYCFLGVRDGESEKFASHMGCVQQVTHTCDPTVFLDINDLPVDEQALREKLTKKGFDFNRPTIGVMGNDLMCDMVRKMYGKQYQIAVLYNYCKKADVNLYDLTPYEWAFVFRYFKLTFTTFFHGTMLSLRNGTPVVCIALETDYSKTHMTKVEDFLIRVGLCDCYFTTDYKTKNLQEIKSKADELLTKDCKDDICKRMDIEARTSKPFFEKIAELLQEKQGEYK